MLQIYMLILGTMLWLNFDLFICRLQHFALLFLKYFTCSHLYSLPAWHFNQKNLLVTMKSRSI